MSYLTETNDAERRKKLAAWFPDQTRTNTQSTVTPATKPTHRRSLSADFVEKQQKLADSIVLNPGDKAGLDAALKRRKEEIAAEQAAKVQAAQATKTAAVQSVSDGSIPTPPPAPAPLLKRSASLTDILAARKIKAIDASKGTEAAKNADPQKDAELAAQRKNEFNSKKSGQQSLAQEAMAFTLRKTNNAARLAELKTEVSKTTENTASSQENFAKALELVNAISAKYNAVTLAKMGLFQMRTGRDIEPRTLDITPEPVAVQAK